MVNHNLDHDEYGEIVNSAKTYREMANTLNRSGSIVIGWTDGVGSHMDIWLTVQPIQAGSLQRGLHAHSDLFVAVMSIGAFGFEIGEQQLDTGYVAEKIFRGQANITCERITDLINGVIKELL